jgi:SNF2 family DNA or RNA helicase
VIVILIVIMELEQEQKIKERMAIYLNRTNMEHKQYQYDGVRWCVGREEGVEGVKGGILADEMGLGKTIVMIGVLLANILPNTLIVVPRILIDQWYDQIYKTTGHRALIYHASKKKDITVEMLAASRIVITTYAAIAIPVKKKNNNNNKLGNKNKPLSLIHEVDWSRVVFDEAHHLRNANSRHNGAMMLRSSIRWLVSGTLVQNKPRDFYNLCAVLQIPKSVSSDIAFVNSHFCLRRTKAQVGIQLAAVVEKNTIVPWNNLKERQLSKRLHAVLDFTNIYEEDREDREDGEDMDFDNDNSGRLIACMRARQVCILPSLSQKLLSYKESRYFHEAFQHTSKMNAVVEELIRTKDNGNGKLVFCNFRLEIDVLVAKLVAEGVRSIGVLDGRTKNTERERVLREKKDVLILQIASGCEGLNLQENYSEIYFVSPHWNPFVEDQAVARCHRLGQTKQVVVNRFEMTNFVEWTSEGVLRWFESLDGLDGDGLDGDGLEGESITWLLQGIWNHEQGLAREIASYFGEEGNHKSVSIDRHITNKQQEKRIISNQHIYG